jgi:transposase
MTRGEFQELYDQGPAAVYAVFQRLEETTRRLEATVVTLSARVRELEDQLRKDSHNSSKPPSSDGLARKPKSLRARSGKKPGGQPGHNGTTLHLSETPDTVVLHAPETCSSCGHGLKDAPEGDSLRRQVYDLPPMNLVVTEHRAVSKRCPHCGTLTRGVFPSHVTEAVQYGPGIKGLLVYLHVSQLLPYKRSRGLLLDLFGHAPSEGVLFNSLEAAHQNLSDVEAGIKEAVTRSQVAGFDETGLRVCDALHWLHTARTETLTFYFHHEKRGKHAMEEGGVLAGFTGVAVHDAFSSYFQFTACEHALCNAHLLREITFVHEQPRQSWSGGMLDLLMRIKRAVEAARDRGETALPQQQRDAFLLEYDRAVRNGFTDNPAAPPSGKKGRRRQSTAYNLLLRLEKHKDAILRFLDRFDVPFDNNGAERDLRMMKVKQKISGCFRSRTGADIFCRVRGYIETLRKQELEILPALRATLTGQPVMPALLG